MTFNMEANVLQIVICIFCVFSVHCANYASVKVDKMTDKFMIIDGPIDDVVSWSLFDNQMNQTG